MSATGCQLSAGEPRCDAVPRRLGALARRRRRADRARGRPRKGQASRADQVRFHLFICSCYLRAAIDRIISA